MAAAAPPAPPATTPLRGVQPLRAGQGSSFLWRKLHSLSGIVPIGAFLIEHIVSNFETMNGPLAYAQQVKFLNSLPLVRVLEWAFIFIPLAFHALYGVFIAFRGRSHRQRLPLGRQLYATSSSASPASSRSSTSSSTSWRQRFMPESSLPGDTPACRFSQGTG